MTAGRAPLSEDRLMRRATAYLARRAASMARMREVLVRAVLRAAGPEGPPDATAVAGLVDAVIARLQRAGLLDDAVFARMKTEGLARKGKPAGAIKAELQFRYGVADPGEAATARLASLDPLAQATRWAERKRLGPFRLRDRAARRDRDIASLVRAGFSGSIARAVIDGDGTVAGED